MIDDLVQFIDGVGSLVKGGVKLGEKIAKSAKAVKELEKGARLAELAKTFVAGAKDSSELNSAVSKAAKVAKLRIVREAEEAKKVEKAASVAEKFRSELDVLKQRAREIPRTLTDDEIRACEAVKLQMKGEFPISRRAAFREAKAASGIPRSAQPITHKFVYDGSTENRMVHAFDIVDSNGHRKYIVEHNSDKMGRGPHFHGADSCKGDPFSKGRYHQFDGHFPEDVKGYKK